MDICNKCMVMFAMLQLSFGVRGFGSEWNDSLLRKSAPKNTFSFHNIVKRQVPWYPDCASCGYSTKVAPPPEDQRDREDKTNESYSVFRTSTLDKMRSDVRCKDAPSVSVCNILKRAQSGFRG